MKATAEQAEAIKSSFLAMRTKKDLVKLLSFAKVVMYGKKVTPVVLKSLNYYANPSFCSYRYNRSTIKKKTGGDRIIHAPTSGLKSILRALNFVLQVMYHPHAAATGFVPDKSIVDNARKHIGHNYVYNLDLKDFFHSFDRNRVKVGFMYEPFNLRDEREPLAFLLASLCTHPLELDGATSTVLPQGAPTSPTITNILCKQLDRRLTGLANRFGITYTRYADDLTFSSPHNVYLQEDFQQELKRLIEDDQHLVINSKKTRLQRAAFRQETTGLIVNEKVNVRRRYVKQLRMQLHFWERYGYDRAEEIFRRDYIADKGHLVKVVPDMINVLEGKFEFLKMVKGVEDGTYNGLLSRFEKLSEKIDPLTKVLDTWEMDGIDQAMIMYSKQKSKSNG
jgi:retron-type reverse transcriptase